MIPHLEYTVIWKTSPSILIAIAQLRAHKNSRPRLEPGAYLTTGWRALTY
jgi:hypothetical protein